MRLYPTGLRCVCMSDPELLRLQKIERLAREQLHRMRSISADPVFIKSAEEIWEEAAATLKVYETS